MTLRKWERQDLVVETMRRLRRKRVTEVAQRIRQMKRTTLHQPHSARTEEASARISRRLMTPH